jgi:hypothetical protein
VASSVPFTRGSKEIVPVELEDRTNITTDLSAASPKFWLREPDLATYVYDNVATTASGMIIMPLIDSSSGGPSGLLDAGDYDFWVGWTNGSEVIKKYVGKLVIADTF